MVPEYVEFVVIHMIYKMGKDTPLMMTRRRDRPSSKLGQVKDWYRRVYSQEVAVQQQSCELPMRLSVREWRIFTGDKSMFYINDKQLDQIFIIIGIETWHWVFFKKDASLTTVEGSAVIPFSYCGCCIFNQYPRILEAIKSTTRLTDEKSDVDM